MTQPMNEMAFGVSLEPTPPSPSGLPPLNRKTLFTSLIGLAILAALGVFIYFLWPQRLPPIDAPTAELVKFVTTDRFANLSDDQKLPYINELLKTPIPMLIVAAAEANLTDAQRQRGLENAMQSAITIRWGTHLDTWLKLDAKGKEDYVKKVAAAMHAPRPPGNRKGRPMTAEQEKGFVEHMSPDRRAAMAEFMKQVQQARGK